MIDRLPVGAERGAVRGEDGGLPGALRDARVDGADASVGHADQAHVVARARAAEVTLLLVAAGWLHLNARLDLRWQVPCRQAAVSATGCRGDVPTVPGVEGEVAGPVRVAVVVEHEVRRR